MADAQQGTGGESSEATAARSRVLGADAQTADGDPTRAFITEIEKAEQLLDAVHRALNRLEDGSYFTCTTCGKRIATSRLETAPTTTVCDRCA